MQDERVIFRMSDSMNISMDAAKKLHDEYRKTAK